MKVMMSLTWDDWERILAAIPFRCPLRAWTGFRCAFCGMTHAWIALLRGEWLRSFHENALGIPFLLLAVLVFIGRVKVNRSLVLGVVLVMIPYMILRNLL